LCDIHQTPNVNPDEILTTIGETGAKIRPGTYERSSKCRKISTYGSSEVPYRRPIL